VDFERGWQDYVVEGMASLTPEAQKVFGARYDEPGHLWLKVFFTPSEVSQAAGRAYLKRFRLRVLVPVGRGRTSLKPVADPLGYSRKEFHHAQSLWKDRARHRCLPWHRSR
jgi:hypothetical protein